jgi:hypothetical protein
MKIQTSTSLKEAVSIGWNLKWYKAMSQLKSVGIGLPVIN